MRHWLAHARSYALALIALMPMSTRAQGDFDATYAGIDALHAAIDSRRISAESLVRYYLDRIERFDQHGPRINALITINPEAIAQARARDLEAGTRPIKDPLYGIPFIVKDNYDSAGLATSGGSAALKDSVPANNAYVLQRLLDAGAILIGKSNMSELAASYGRLGYSSAGGLTLNPYNTARDASGSSSGSAAAVAADFAPFALGTDTSGSVRAPASVTGLVGLHPTAGLLSRGGIMPSSLTFDTPGILARSARDVSIVLAAVAGEDPNDAATYGTGVSQVTPAATTLPALALRGVRLGVVSNFRAGNEEIDRIERSALRALERQGAVLVPITLPPPFETLWSSVLEPVGEAEFKPQFERYLASLPATRVRTLRQLIEISSDSAIANSATPVNPARLAALRAADASALTDSPLYIRILTQVLPSLRAQLEALLRTQRVAALMFSTMSCPATPRFDEADPSYVCHSDDPYRAGYVASVAGWPEITVPAGRISANVPVGISFLGAPFTEPRLLALAAAFERTHPALPHPSLRP